MKHTTPMGNERGRVRAGVVLPLIVASAALSWATLRAEVPARGHSGESGLIVAQQGQETSRPKGDVEAAEAALQAAFTAAGVLVDRVAAAVAIPVSAEVRTEYLEYVLVNPHGAVHETLLVTPVDAQVLGTAFLSVGAEAGKNVEYLPKDPPPTPAEARAGAKTHDVVLPSGKPLFLYVTWKEHAGVPDPSTGEYPDVTLHFHRLEDLIVDLERDRTLRRHGWIWLGSRILPPAKDGGAERFAADVTGNLASVSFFPQGDTLLTPALPECESQTSWIANRWLLPAPGAQMLLIGSLKILDGVPDGFAEAVPLIPVDAADPRPLVSEVSEAKDD